MDGAAQVLFQRVSRRPCLLAAAGLLVVLLDVRVGFFDLLADAAGYAAVAYAVTRPPLNGTAAGHRRRVFVAAMVGLGSAVPELVSVGWTYHPGTMVLSAGSWSPNTFGRLLALVGALATAALLVLLCDVVARQGAHSTDLVAYARRARSWVAVPVGLDALLSLVVVLGGQPAPELVGALVMLGVYAAFAGVIVLVVWLDQVTRPG